MNRIFTLFLIVLLYGISHAQSDTNTLQTKDSITYEKGKEYILGGFDVLGLNRFSEQSVKIHSGLVKGTKIRLPGDKLSAAIKKLYETEQFSKVDVYLTKLDGDTAYLQFEVEETPQLEKVVFPGFNKAKSKTFTEEAKLKPGMMVTDNLIVTTRNFFIDKFKNEGYRNVKVLVSKTPAKNNRVNLKIIIVKNKKIKIKELRFHGNEKIKNRKLKRKMKKTKQRSFGRFWKRSKFIEEDFRNDLENIISYYRELGYRDAIIKNTGVKENPDNTLSVNIDIDEGKQYFFGDINFIGNTVYSDRQLSNFLRLKKGDLYNAELLKDRVTGDGTPDSEDILSLYLNNGYMFANVTPVETQVKNDSIYVEIRIREDEQATIRKVSVSGNTVTNDKVIYRELRTRPGDLFSKQEIIRSIRELSQLRYFDPEAISPDIKPDPISKTVDIEYSVAEKSSSQIELQGGYGNHTFIGTLGLAFNNFSIQDIFNPEAYKPLPRGNGQSFSIRYQTSKFYNTFSLSFREPWLGGKKPKDFSISLYSSSIIRHDYSTYQTYEDQGFKILGATVGLGNKLKWPDDFFILSQNVQYQRYKLDNYKLFSNINFTDGTANNFAYSVTLARNSSGPNPIFPMGGSNISLTLKLTPPYSLLSGKDYQNLASDEKYRWLEYHKTTFKSTWYKNIWKKLVLRTNAEFGIMGYYNKDLGYSPFEGYRVGGDGMQQYRYDGSETIGLRGYGNATLTPNNTTGVIYDKFSLEMRYPITIKPSATIYVLGFTEAGNAYYDMKSYNPFKMKRSAGAGLRLFMPMFGLLGIDFAYGFDSVPGNNAPSGWQTHFTIGKQF